ncbi:MAG TPA: hypothetical protein VFJ13_08825 [Paracoccaceae bacterium]|nr:hypothetical protein [Paracoccaceae bacterium]
MRRWLLSLLVFMLAPCIALAAEALNGTYLGVDDAAGARIRIAPDAAGYSGTFYDPQGNSQAFKADRIEGTAEAVLDMGGQTVLMRVAPVPSGALVSIVPFRADGTLAFEFSRALGFVREGVALPEKPENFMPAPRRPGEAVSANAFVESYQFWDPAGVVNGYLGIPDQYRTIMRMFPAVQLDVIWKLCLAPQADRALAIALRGQGVACPEVVDTIARTQRSNRFDDYKAEVEAERQALQVSVQCADGHVLSKATCDAASRRLAEAAVSLRTAGMVLAKYR